MTSDNLVSDKNNHQKMDKVMTSMPNKLPVLFLVSVSTEVDEETLPHLRRPYSRNIMKTRNVLLN